MQFKLIIIALIIVCTTACKKQSHYPVDEINCTLDYSSNPHHEHYQSILDEYTANGITGLTVIMSSPEKGYWIGSSGYSSIEDNQKMNPCNLHHTASLAKSFTAIIILQLIEEGKLHFDDLIPQYLSNDIVTYIPNIEKITIKDLLQQTSGIPEVFDINFFEDFMNNPEKTYTSVDFIEMIAGKESVFEPGEKHLYSDLNYIILGLIIDNVEGDHVAAYSERILVPLGLDDSYYHNGVYPEPEGLVASYWDQYNNGAIENISELQIRITNYIKASDGIIASAQNMVRFYEAVFNNELISEEMVELIKTDLVTEENEQLMNTGYSHGFMTIDSTDERWIGHTGSHIGSSCYVYKNIETEATIGVFTNTGVHFFTEKKGLIYSELWNDLRNALN
ncbi:MAG: D-alanyl-D-alanine carboxypeptidase [Crocinitomix sp.]|jgi:D-alanyl-D-alanine carboxypeptidase